MNFFIIIYNKLFVELLTELARRERDAGIFPEAEIDLFMKVIKPLTISYSVTMIHFYML